METRSFRAGTVLLREGEKTQQMYVIQKGKARVYKTYLQRRVTLAVLGQGEVFGEMSFFDAAPRSASVEALTDLEAMVIEGSTVKAEITGLPDWIMPILRTTFERFREADNKIMLLQSMNDYQKKVFDLDTVGKTIYLELLRYIRLLRLIHDPRPGQNASVVFTQMDEVLGTQRMLNLRVFWKELYEHDMIKRMPEDASPMLIGSEDLEGLTEYLSDEASTERFLVLSHTSVIVLRRIVANLDTSDVAAGQERDPILVPLDETVSRNLPFFRDAVEELVKQRILRREAKATYGIPTALRDHFVCQDILKAFDHATMSVE